jgi:Type IV secretion system pilin
MINVMKLSKLLLCFAVLSLAVVFFGQAPKARAAVNCSIIPQYICDQAVNGSNSGANNSALGSAEPLVNWIIGILVALFGSLLILIMIVSAVQISASGGSEDRIKSAKENIFKAATGLVLLISASAIIGIINGVFAGVITSSLFGYNATSNGRNVRIGDGLSPLGIPVLITNITGVAAGLAGTVSVIFVIVGGIRYTTSAGSEKNITSAKKTIVAALGGLVLSLTAYALLSFIQTQLTK